MNTWNTINITSHDRLEKAISMLSTLSEDLSIKIVEYLRCHGTTSLLDLSIHTGFDSCILEDQLERLRADHLVLREDTLYGSSFQLNHFRFLKAMSIAKQLGWRGLRRQ